MSKTLVVVDMQYDFMMDEVLGNERCRNVISKIVNKIKTKEYDKIIFTQDTHNEDYLETQEGKNLPVKHCIKGSKGWEVVKDISIAAHDMQTKEIIYLPKYTFGSIKLPELIADDEEIELVGVCTGICVISNAMLLKAFKPESKIIVDSSCCACVSEESHKNALEAMALCQITIK